MVVSYIYILREGSFEFFKCSTLHVIKMGEHIVSVSWVFSHRVSLSTGLKKGYSRVGIYTTRDLLLPTFFPPICSVCLLAAVYIYEIEEVCSNENTYPLLLLLHAVFQQQ